VFLGRDNSDYCNWILDKENWGGTCHLVFVHGLECRAGKNPGLNAQGKKPKWPIRPELFPVSIALSD